MFIQIHTLTSYHASLLNRDDGGLAKRIPFGNAQRMRVSSQCLKKHWRDYLRNVLPQPGAIRSRLFFEREVLPRVIEAGVSEQVARQLIEPLVPLLIDGGQDTKKGSLYLKQPVLLGKPEADYIVKLVIDIASGSKPADEILKEWSDKKSEASKLLRQNLKAMKEISLASGFEGALFGRFVTSDILTRTDAAVHVAHAMTVHPLSTEVDYFTVVDDLKGSQDDAGAAHANDMELGAGLFYGYTVVDTKKLIENLGGISNTPLQNQPQEILNDAKIVLHRLIEAITTVSPGAKLGSTAPYSRAACVLLEVGTGQPRTLANAFLQALKLKADPVQQSIEAMGQHLTTIDDMYGKTEQRFVSSTHKTDCFQSIPHMKLQDSIEKALQATFGDS